MVVDRYATGRITPESNEGNDRQERKVGELIAQLEQKRSRLEQVRLRARRQGGREGKRLEAQAEVRLRDIEERINDLRASLGE